MVQHFDFVYVGYLSKLSNTPTFDDFEHFISVVTQQISGIAKKATTLSNISPQIMSSLPYGLMTCAICYISHNACIFCHLGQLKPISKINSPSGKGGYASVMIQRRYDLPNSTNMKTSFLVLYSLISFSSIKACNKTEYIYWLETQSNSFQS